jgi:hypothetical protein
MERLLRQKFDAELRTKYTGRLAEKGIHRQPEARVISPGSRHLRQWAAAASLLLAGGIALWFFLKPATQNYGSMADAFLLETASRATQTRMGADTAAIDVNWEKAQEAYTRRAFGEATRFLESLANQQTLTPAQAYLLALCHLQTEPPAFDEALRRLADARQAIAADPGATYREEIDWVTALALLQKSDRLPPPPASNK